MGHQRLAVLLQSIGIRGNLLLHLYLVSLRRKILISTENLLFVQLWNLTVDGLVATWGNALIAAWPHGNCLKENDVLIDSLLAARFLKLVSISRLEHCLNVFPYTR